MLGGGLVELYHVSVCSFVGVVCLLTVRDISLWDDLRLDEI
jgi:hypothetical protein